MKEVLSVLDPFKPKTADEILDDTGIDINSDPQLFQELKLNPMVTFKEPGEFYYKVNANLLKEDIFNTCNSLF